MRSLIALSVLAGFMAAPAFAADAPDVYKKKCELCHSVGGAGGAKKDIGGPLDGVGKKHDEAWLTAYLKDPKSKKPDGKMPKMPLSDADLSAVVAYLGTLK